MPTPAIHLRAFELRAGPKSARLITVNPQKSIAEVYTHICGVLKLDAPLSRVSFHRTHDKKIDTAPLSITAPISVLGLADNDIFIIRLGYRSRSAARTDNSAAQAQGSADTIAAAATAASSSSPPVQQTADPQSEEEEAVARATDPLSPAVAASSHTNTSTPQYLSESIGRETVERSAATELQRWESCRQHCAQHSNVIQVFVMKVFQLLTVVCSPPPAASFASPHLGPIRSSATMKDLHRDVLRLFCQRTHLPMRRAEELLAGGGRDMEAVYEALNFYVVHHGDSGSGSEAGDSPTAPDSSCVEEVEAWLTENIPPLRPAAFLICALHPQREVEFLEHALLRLLGQPPTALTWLCLRDAALPGKKGFYSAVVRMAQPAAPTHVPAAEIVEVSVAGPDCSCVAWGLYNTPYRGHLPPMSCWVWSHLAAAVLTGREDAAQTMSDVLSMYSEWEAALTWVG